MRLAVFASGSGSNFEAITKAAKSGMINGSVEVLICDKQNAYALKRAEKLGVPAYVFQAKEFESKAAFESAILKKLEENQIELIILAGYMRLVGGTLLSAFEGRILNIHPSLLPAFPGLDAVGQAMDAGVKVTGVTVHYVDAGMDTGPIIAQEPLKIYSGDKKEVVQKKIQQVEHQLYPEVIQYVIEELSGRV
ncbi:phosphoribosylglycinamide formyltransferase [Evansella tamaricis]|uniref:Phosphoribosylglycinamide formyltransferase n=1 Tax=Evansella tamaricis TaxID=2069301 RepID=A0ABS6JB12_9BACI|nr:phosphoribosylglycinamide formyltransferase [Evansella tamaricis]MBU9710703.1 phosphoribosylglycinamide formyltransferase [Evansella tamaricis]